VLVSGSVDRSVKIHDI
jgi:WD40 repeat protein